MALHQNAEMYLKFENIFKILIQIKNKYIKSNKAIT